MVTLIFYLTVLVYAFFSKQYFAERKFCHTRSVLRTCAGVVCHIHVPVCVYLLAIPCPKT